MNPDEQHAEDWSNTKKHSEDMLQCTGDRKYQHRIDACNRLLATIK